MSAPTLAFQLLRPRNLLVFLGAFCLLTGWQAGAPGLWVMGLGASSLWLASAATAAGLLRNPKAQRTHEERVFQGDWMDVQLVLETDSHLPHFLTEIQDQFPPAGATVVRALHPGLWRRGHLARMAFTLPCQRHRGHTIAGPVRVRAADPLGLFERETLIPTFTSVLVYPQAPALRELDLLGEGTRQHTGIDTVRHAGASEEFIGLRDYQVGDSPRRIHWPTSAHHGRLLVKQFQDERTTEVSIVLDLGRMGLTGLGEQTTSEYAIRAAATLARQAFERGHAFQLFAIGEKVEHVPLGGGMQHLLALLDRLVFLRAEGGRDFASELGRLREWFLPGSTLALIFSATTLRIDPLAPLLENLARHHVRILVILVDDRGFPKLFEEQERQHGRAAPLEDAVMQLRLLGARVHILSRHSDPAEGVRTGLGLEAQIQPPAEASHPHARATAS